jgi:hypothetical protein
MSMPPAIMKQEVKTSSGPATSVGTVRKKPESLGEAAKTTRKPAAAKAMIRDVAPVAPEMPTRLGALHMPVTPMLPPITFASPSARTPRCRLPESGLCQTALFSR